MFQSRFGVFVVTPSVELPEKTKVNASVTIKEWPTRRRVPPVSVRRLHCPALIGALRRSQKRLNSALPEASLLGLSLRIAMTTSPPGPNSVVSLQFTSLPLAIPAAMKWSAALQKLVEPASQVIPSVDGLVPG